MNNIQIFDQVFDIMKESFPEAEYRDYQEQKLLLTHPRYSLLTEKNEQQNVIGFLAGWKFDEFSYVENVAVFSSIRGGGIGKKLMERFMEQATLPIVLEVELPMNEINQRRIGFYKRLGFQLCEFPYVQPPLRTGFKPLPLKIMSFPDHLSSIEFEKVRHVLYKEVYDVAVIHN